jgi:hypothetical protein
MPEAQLLVNPHARSELPAWIIEALGTHSPGTAEEQR